MERLAQGMRMDRLESYKERVCGFASGGPALEHGAPNWGQV